MSENEKTPNLFEDALKAKAAEKANTEQAKSEPAKTTMPANEQNDSKEMPKEAPKEASQSNTEGGQETNGDGNDASSISELDVLKNRARMMGVDFSNNIGVETLRQKIQDKLDGNDREAQEKAAAAKAAAEAEAAMQAALAQTAGSMNAAPVEAPRQLSEAEKKMKLRKEIMDENLRLIRIRVTCLDPKKKDLPGEIFTVANEYIGTVRKFVPFGEATDNGFHVPYCIYKMMKRRRFTQIKTSKGKMGIPIVSTNDVREFAIEVLEPLTVDEIAKLAASQTSRGMDN